MNRLLVQLFIHFFFGCLCLTIECSKVAHPASCQMEIPVHQDQPRDIQQKEIASWQAYRCLEK